MSDHPGDERLQRLADGELAEAEVRQHVGACAECAARLDEIGRAGDAYRAWHQAMKAHDPAPPRPWEDLRPRMEAPERRGSWRAWGAVAAAVVVAVGGYYRMSRPTPVNAAELLRKAVAVEKPAMASRRIRVRTAKREVVRPAVLTGARSDELETLFVSAQFSWQEPLSARSFSAWRDRLPDKQDAVRQSASQYEIETTTSTGPLRSATIVLDARDLRPVRETLEFTTERVEIVETQAETQAEPEAITGTPRPPAVVLPAPPGPAEELRAIAALHAIGADLGEPVQVTRNETFVVVSSTGLTEAREKEVRAAVAGLPGVVFQVRPVADSRSAESSPAKVVAGTPSQLLGVLGEEGVNRILDASEAVMARVFALRGLARRFPQVVEAQLADADRDVLAALRGEHVAGIRRYLGALQASVAPLLPKAAPMDPAAAADWRAAAERTFTAAQAVDHLLNRVLAGGQEFARIAPELAEALARLEAEVRP
jgi:hypothetical protein